MSKFKIKTPLVNKMNANEAEIKSENFGNDSAKHTVNSNGYDPKSKPDKSFTIPLNSYELFLLRKIAKKLDRSQRYMARKLLVQALEFQDTGNTSEKI